jgi:hypothetical protein
MAKDESASEQMIRNKILLFILSLLLLKFLVSMNATNAPSTKHPSVMASLKNKEEELDESPAWLCFKNRHTLRNTPEAKKVLVKKSMAFISALLSL